MFPWFCLGLLALLASHALLASLALLALLVLVCSFGSACACLLTRFGLCLLAYLVLLALLACLVRRVEISQERTSATRTQQPGFIVVSVAPPVC